MEIKEINNKNIWEDFLLGCEEKTFLQSWNWGEFQMQMGNKIWRVGVYGDDELLGIVLVSKIVAKRGTFLLIQHGPTIIKNETYNAKQILEYLLKELQEIGKKENCNFIRMNPSWERSRENQIFLKNLGFKEAPMHANAYEATLKLDITLPEEELLRNMRKTTRYLIRQAQKDRDIEIFQRWDISDVEIFNQIHQEVVRVQKFVPFSLEYFKKEFLAFQADDKIRIFFAKYKGKIAAASYVIFWSNIGFYHHAALLPEYHKLPLSYFLQWEAIKEAKKRGCVLYDFWGFVDPEKHPKHPWAGPTLFKMGFGGKAYEYVKTQDFPLSLKYWLTYIFEKLRKTKRGL
jgi:lipid II:glycine glycyltransferase (peptidoglycan interpeptide bridge formation enzyme)